MLGHNMFAYCNNTPPNAIDPHGMCTTVFFGLFKKDCHNATCPDSENYNPEASKAVVIYDGRFSGYLGRVASDDGFEHQGQELVKRLSRTYDVSSYAYVTMDDFVACWNSLDAKYEDIYIVGHGEIGSFNAIGGKLTKNGEEYNYSMLNRVSVSTIHLYICNGATLDAYGKSTAIYFSELTYANVVAIKNGKMNFTWWGCYPYPDPDYDGTWTMISPIRVG